MKVLEAIDVWFAYTPEKYVLRAVTFGVESGKIIMIFGRSGEGKTTLLKLLKGILKPTRGEVRYRNRSITSVQSSRELYRAIGYIPQGFGVVSNLTVLENVVIGALSRVPSFHAILGSFPEEEVAKAEAILDSLGIGDLKDVKVSKISGGQRQRVAIARALMQDPEVILADEFVSQLDPVTALEVMEDFKQLSKVRGIGVVMTSHDVNLIPEYADEVMVLRDGVIAFRTSKRIGQDELMRVMK